MAEMNFILMLFYSSLIAGVLSSKHVKSSSKTINFTSSNKLRKGPTLEMNTTGKLRQLFAMEALIMNERENSVCSPVSAMFPLGKLALGIGKKAPRDLFEVLGLKTEQDIEDQFRSLISHMIKLPGVKMSIAGKLYVPSPLRDSAKPQFMEQSQYVFNSDMDEINFDYPNHASKLINEYVKRRTRNRIDSIIMPRDIPRNLRRSSVLIINGISAQLVWQLPFTYYKDLPFYTARTGTTLVPMMYNKDKYYYTESAALNARLIEVPLDKNQASLIIVMPESQTGLKPMLRKIKHQPDLIDKALKNMTFREVTVSIPKFNTVQTTFNLIKLYESIGLHHIFKAKSDLTNIIEKKELMVETAIQKCSFSLINDVILPSKPFNLRNESLFIEKWTIIDPMLYYIRKVEFTVDRPFLYYILMKAMNEQIFVGIYTEYIDKP